jgi:hypothetical protein
MDISKAGPPSSQRKPDGQSLTDWANAVATPAGLVELTGQIIFGAMPIFVGCCRSAI